MVVTGAACPSLLVERANIQSIKKRAAGREGTKIPESDRK